MVAEKEAEIKSLKARIAVMVQGLLQEIAHTYFALHPLASISTSSFHQGPSLRESPTADGESLEVRFDECLPMLQCAGTLLPISWPLAEASTEYPLRHLTLQWKPCMSAWISGVVRPPSRTFSTADSKKQVISSSGWNECSVSAWPSGKTHDTLLHGRLQEGLLYKLMEVSGAQKYTELRMCCSSK